MNEVNKNSVDWGSLLLGILFVITALLSFQNPASNLIAIVMVFAIFAIFKGVYEIFFRNKWKQLTGNKAYALLFLGVIDIIFGLFLLFHLEIGLIALPYIFALWFIISSIFNLLTTDLAKAISTAYFWFTVIINIVAIFIGIFLFIDPITSGLTLSFLVGFYFMLFGMLNIVYAFRK